jgi:hypothetical protein
MTTLEILASLVMDAYNQEYAKSSDYFDIDDFKQYCSIFYGQALQEDFNMAQKTARINKVDHSYIPTYLNKQWYKTKKFEVQNKNDVLTIEPLNIFSFSNDNKISSIRSLVVTNPECCCEATKIFGSCRDLKFLPKSDKSIYYSPSYDKIQLHRAPFNTKEVEITYIPSVNDETDEIQLPEGIISKIMVNTYNFMTAARAQKIVDKTNDQNPNVIIQKEA